MDCIEGEFIFSVSFQLLFHALRYAIQTDIMLLCRQHQSASESEIEGMLDKLIKHYISGADMKGSVQLRTAMRTAAADELEQAKQSISCIQFLLNFSVAYISLH